MVTQSAGLPITEKPLYCVPAAKNTLYLYKAVRVSAVADNFLQRVKSNPDGGRIVVRMKTEARTAFEIAVYQQLDFVVFVV